MKFDILNIDEGLFKAKEEVKDLTDEKNILQMKLLKA
jgi:hypothetical protein